MKWVGLKVENTDGKKKENWRINEKKLKENPDIAQHNCSPGVDPAGPVVIILATGSEVHWFKPVRGRWIFLEHKNPEYDFLRKGSKAVGPVS